MSLTASFQVYNLNPQYQSWSWGRASCFIVHCLQYSFRALFPGNCLAIKLHKTCTVCIILMGQSTKQQQSHTCMQRDRKSVLLEGNSDLHCSILEPFYSTVVKQKHTRWVRCFLFRHNKDAIEQYGSHSYRVSLHDALGSILLTRKQGSCPP